MARVEHAPAMLFGARRLMLQMAGWLMARRSGVTAFTLRWCHDAMRAKSAGDGGELTVRTAQATRHGAPDPAAGRASGQGRAARARGRPRAAGQRGGASQPEGLVERAKQLGYAALAITDECSLAGVARACARARP